MIKDLEKKQDEYIKLFGSDLGEEILEDLGRHCYMNRPTINDNPHMTAFNEGKRSVLLHIKTMMNTDFKKLREQQTKNRR